jgi:hypothetical protein
MGMVTRFFRNFIGQKDKILTRRHFDEKVKIGAEASDLTGDLIM